MWFPTLRGKVQALILNGRWWHKEHFSVGRAEFWDRTCKWNYQGHFRRESRKKPPNWPLPTFPIFSCYEKIFLTAFPAAVPGAGGCWEWGISGSPSKGSTPGVLALPFPCSGKGAGGSRGCKWGLEQLPAELIHGIDVGIVCDAPAVDFPITVKKAKGIKGGWKQSDISWDVP